MLSDLLFQKKLKIKNPAGATTDNSAISIAMETPSFSNVDQIRQVIA